MSFEMGLFTLFGLMLILAVAAVVIRREHEESEESDGSEDAAVRDAKRWLEAALTLPRYKVFVRTRSGLEIESAPFDPDLRMISPRHSWIERKTSKDVAMEAIDTAVSQGFFAFTESRMVPVAEIAEFGIREVKP